MANARTLFDALAADYVRQHECRTGLLDARPALFLHQQPFAVFHQDRLAVRLHGRALRAALALEGVQAVDPLRPGADPIPGWIEVSARHQGRWSALLREAFATAELAHAGQVSYRLPDAPTSAPESASPPSSPESLAERAKAALAPGSSGLKLERPTR